MQDLNDFEETLSLGGWDSNDESAADLEPVGSLSNASSGHHAAAHAHPQNEAGLEARYQVSALVIPISVMLVCLRE